MTHWQWVALMAWALSSCTVGPEYQRPPAAAPVRWGELPSSDGQRRPSRAVDRPMDVTEWWKTFHDPILESLVERAWQANLDLRQAEFRVSEARASRAVVAGGQWPALGGTASYTRLRVSQNGLPIPNGDFSKLGIPGLDIDQYQAGFDAAWEVDVFGGVRRKVEAADANVEATVESLRDVWVSLLGEVARNYVELRGAQREKSIAEENVKVQGENLELTRLREVAGLTTDLDVTRAQAQVETTAAQIPAFDNQIRRAIHRLGVLLGQEPGTLMGELSPPLPIPTPPPEVAVGVPADVLRRRPDIRGAERELAQVTAEVGAATADLYPKFFLAGMIGLQSLEFPTWGSWASRAWSAGPAVSVPFFQGGRLQAGVAVQNARQQQALARYQRTVLMAFEEAENALSAFASDQDRRKRLAGAVAANRRALELAREQYAQGLQDFLNVVDAQRALLLTEDALAQSDQAISVDLVALYKALGGGWELRQPETPH